MTDPRFLVGQLLLSMPGIGDARFDRAVIAMCVHDDDGALGLMVNRPHADLTVRDLMAQLDVDPGNTPADARVMAGGPVEPGRGFVLHSPDYAGQGTITVGGLGGVRWGLTSTVDVLKAIAERQGAGALAGGARLHRLGRGAARRANSCATAGTARRRRRRLRLRAPLDAPLAARVRAARHRRRPSVGGRRAGLEDPERAFSFELVALSSP